MIHAASATMEAEAEVAAMVVVVEEEAEVTKGCPSEDEANVSGFLEYRGSRSRIGDLSAKMDSKGTR
jgi:hypothetical protein